MKYKTCTLMGRFSFTEITTKAQNAFNRFPITLIWAIIGTIICIGLVEDSSGKLFEEHSNLVLTLLLGISWLIGIRFLIEQMDNPKKWLWLKAIGLLLLLAFYWHLPAGFIPDNEPEYFLRFFLYFIAGHLFVFFAPFVLKWQKEAFWNYLKASGLAIIRSAFFSGVLFLGLILALAAIDALFEVHIDGKRYGQLFMFCAGIINTWIYLSDFPKDIQRHQKIDFNKALEVFVKYILIPLVILYLIILYAYSFKILIEWELPKGWVSYLVTALALLGFIVQVIINPVQKTLKSWTIRSFHPFFYILLLPLVILLFVAIFRRISDYGITENRYFVVVMACWILAMCFYVLFAKNRRLIILPISLFFLALVSSFGYWGAISVSMRSQTAQFASVYKTVKANANMATSKQHEQLRSILEYMNNRNALSKLDTITNMDMDGMLKDTAENRYRWFDSRSALDSLGIALNPNDPDIDYILGKSYNYYNNDAFAKEALAIAAFDYFTTIQLNQYIDEPITMGDVLVQYDKVDNALDFTDKIDSSEIYTLALGEKMRELMRFNSNIPKGKESVLAMDFENDRILGKLIFNDLGYNLRNDTITLNHSRAYLFIKRK